jgi:endonuclease III
VNADKRFEFFKRLREENPIPKTELNYGSNFQLLIAVILSAQATDLSVNKATKNLFAIAPTAERMALLDEETVKKKIKTIGLFNTKAANVYKTCRILLKKYGGRVPCSRSELEALPGVGRKTANVILNTAFGEPTIAVDTHIFRVSNRTKLAPGKTPLQVEKNLMKKIHTDFHRYAHHWLILHGRYTCLARSPKCGSCVVSDYCSWSEKKKYNDN